MKASIAAMLLLFSIAGHASGWHDFELDIGEGYSIFRANTFDISLSRNGQIIVSHYDFNEIGPIVGYFKNSAHILLKAAGWKPRKLFPNDDFKDIDFSKSLYFVVRVQDGKVEGPLSEEEFDKNPSVIAIGNFEWTKPKNPNFWLPVLGTLFFILVSIPILYVKYWHISVPITVLIGYWWMRRYKTRHNQV